MVGQYGLIGRTYDQTISVHQDLNIGVSVLVGARQVSRHISDNPDRQE